MSASESEKLCFYHCVNCHRRELQTISHWRWLDWRESSRRLQTDFKKNYTVPWKYLWRFVIVTLEPATKLYIGQLNESRLASRQWFQHSLWFKIFREKNWRMRFGPSSCSCMDDVYFTMYLTVFFIPYYALTYNKTVAKFDVYWNTRHVTFALPFARNFYVESTSACAETCVVSDAMPSTRPLTASQISATGSCAVVRHTSDAANDICQSIWRQIAPISGRMLAVCMSTVGCKTFVDFSAVASVAAACGSDYAMTRIVVGQQTVVNWDNNTSSLGLLHKMRKNWWLGVEKKSQRHAKLIINKNNEVRAIGCLVL